MSQQAESSSLDPKISLCLTVRDEAHLLARCLENALPAADELIIVDTGSKDNSIEIAKSFGARVYEQPWNDSFSDARNYTLQFATHPWILWLDADEMLQPGGKELIREAVQRKQAAGYYLAFTNFHDDGKTDDFLLPRLFVNHPEVRWVNAIHSQIMTTLQVYAKKNNLSVDVCAARIFHYGYLNSEMSRKGKMERTRRLFEKQLAMYPDDPYSWYKFGDFTRKQDRNKGVEALRHCVELLRRASPEARALAAYAAEAIGLLASELQALKRPEEAWAALLFAEELGVALTPNYYFGRACIAKDQNRLDEAIQNFEKCLTFINVSLPVPVQWGITGPLSNYGLAQCFEQQGKLDLAEKFYLTAHQQAPDELLIVLRFADFYDRQGRWPEALELLLKYRQDPNHKDPLWEQLGEKILAKVLKNISQNVGLPLAEKKT